MKLLEVIINYNKTVPKDRIEFFKSKLENNPDLKNLDFNNVEFVYDETNKLRIKNFSCKKHTDWVKTEFTRYNRVMDLTSGCKICGDEIKSQTHKKPTSHYLNWAKEKFSTYNWDNVKVESGFVTLKNGTKESNPTFSGIVCNKHKDHPNYVSPLKPTLRNLKSSLSWSKNPEELRGNICDLCSKENYKKVSTERNTYSVDKWNEILSSNPQTKNLYIDVTDENLETRTQIKRMIKDGNSKENTYVKNIKCRNHEPHFTFGKDWLNIGSIVVGHSLCPLCNKGIISKGEKLVLSTLEQLNYKISTQKKFEGCISVNQKKVCTKLKFDAHIMIGKQEVCVEYDGKQHFEPTFGKSEYTRQLNYNILYESDNIKNKFIKTNKYGLGLIRIPHTLKEGQYDKLLENALQRVEKNEIDPLGDYPERQLPKEPKHKDKIKLNESKLSLIDIIKNI